MSEHIAPVMPHGELQEVFPNVFFVTGSVAMQNGAMQISRNMTVLRDGTDLTLINTIRLNEEGLQALDALGNVKHVLKIGSHHNMDDAFFVEHYKPKVWALEGMEAAEGVSFDEVLAPGTQLPVANTSLFVFETSKTPEAIVFLNREGGVLISCDSLHNWVAVDEYFNELATEKMTEWGFIQPANIGPGWLRGSNPQPQEFAALLELPFKHLLSGHGVPLKDTAHEEFTTRFKGLGLVS